MYSYSSTYCGIGVFMSMAREVGIRYGLFIVRPEYRAEFSPSGERAELFIFIAFLKELGTSRKTSVRLLGT